MGWAAGSYLFEAIWGKLRLSIREEERVAMCAMMIEKLDRYDADEWRSLPSGLSIKRRSGNCAPGGMTSQMMPMK